MPRTALDPPPLAMIRGLLLAIFLAAPAAAQTLLGAEEFEDLSTGRTLHFERAGLHYGSEQYMAGRHTLWQTGDGQCQRGIWYPSGELICFLYETGGPACWRVARDGGRLSASVALPEGGFGEPIELSGFDTQPLDCPGPDLGV